MLTNNQISVHFDPTTVCFGDLKRGQMFRFADGRGEENVYMKMANHAIFLVTGDDYEINPTKLVTAIPIHAKVTITQGSR